MTEKYAVLDKSSGFIRLQLPDNVKQYEHSLMALLYDKYAYESMNIALVEEINDLLELEIKKLVSSDS